MNDIDKLNKYRLLHASAGHIIPLIVERRKSTIALMISKYKDGKQDFIGEAAELAVLLDLETKINMNESKLNNLEEKRANDYTSK